MRSLFLCILALNLVASNLSACKGDGSGEQDCTPQAQIYCDSGISYWVDSCGEIGEQRSQCDCGCTSDHSECELCPCTPSVVTRLIWSADIECSGRHRAAVGRNGTVFVTSSHSSPSVDDYLYALDPHDGDTLWSVPADSHEYEPPTPAIGHDGTVYAPLGDHLDALNPNDGSLYWSFETSDRVQTPLVGADGTVYVACEDWILYSLDPQNGSQNWTFYMEMAPDAPALGTDGTIYVPCFDGSLYAVNHANGTQRWKFEAQDLVRTPAVGPDGTVYLPSRDQHLYALSPQNGSVKWTFPVGDGARTPVVAPNGTVYVPAWDGQLYALEPTDGSIIWQYNVYNPSPPTLGADGTIYLGTASGDVRVLDPLTGEQIWYHQAFGDVASLTIGNGGTLFVAGTAGVEALSPDPDAISMKLLACVPCELSCSDATQVGRCKDDGSAQETIAPCGSSQTCLNAECITCETHDHKACVGNDVYWFDSCDHQEELSESCSGGLFCSGGICDECHSCHCVCNACTADTNCTGSGCGGCEELCTDACADCGGLISYSPNC